MLKIGILVDGDNARFWCVDYIKLMQHILRKYEAHDPEFTVKRMYITVNEDLDQANRDSFLCFIKRVGFAIIKRLYKSGQRADVDAHIGSDLRRYSSHCDLIVLIAGDGDYLPVLENLVDESGKMFLVITKESDTSSMFYSYKDQTYPNIEIETIDDLHICDESKMNNS